VKFLATSFLILAVLLFGMLFGIYQATQILGIEREKEVEVVKKTKPLVKKEVKQEVKLVQKEEMTLLERQERAREVQAMNVYSELGETIGDGVENMFKQLIVTATTEMNDLLNGQ